MNCDDCCHRGFIFLSKVLQFNFMNGFLLFPSLLHNNKKKTSLQSRFTFYARSRTQIMFPVRRESNGVSITLKIISEEYFLFSSKVICVNEACNNSRKNKNEKKSYDLGNVSSWRLFCFHNSFFFKKKIPQNLDETGPRSRDGARPHSRPGGESCSKLPSWCTS